MNIFLNPTRNAAIAFIASILIGISSATAAHHELKIDKEKGTNVVLRGYDAVSYFNEMEARKGSPDITAKWMGAVWQFSSEANKKTFLENPDRYVPEYGGRCAVSVFVGEASVANPACFVIEADRLFLLSTPDLAKTLKADFSNIVSKADALWPSLKDEIKFEGN